jgi:tRNA-Thr(GGU) m(6)t(6)A37 methyltransferase TsaA
MNEILFTPIGFARTPFNDTAQVPKGPGTKHEASGTIEILPEFAEGLKDIEGFSHLFILWVFDRADGYDLLGAPPGEEILHGVFATRSPRRPNPIALTVVRLLRRDGPVLDVHGVDMLDQTPILDIKPYMSSIPMETLRRGWLEDAEKRSRNV